jgi:hypothetical protein
MRISVPKTPRESYNPDRPAGKLLQAQTLHLREGLIRHLHEVAALVAVDLKSLKTERDVGTYTREVTAILHPHGARQPRK